MLDKVLEHSHYPHLKSYLENWSIEEWCLIIFVLVVVILTKIWVLSLKCTPGWKMCGFTHLWVFDLRIIPSLSYLGLNRYFLIRHYISSVISLCYGICFALHKSCFDGKQILVEDIVCKAWNVVDDYKFNVEHACNVICAVLVLLREIHMYMM